MKKIELEITIPKELDGKRLDVALSELLPEYSRSKIQSWIKAGEVGVNNLNHRQRDVVNANDIIKINTVPKNTDKDQAEAIDLNVIHEDDEIIIINKQAGLVVHPGAGNQKHTLVNALLHFDKNLDVLPRAGIVHRLDKDTTGIMIIARTIKSHTHLVNELQKRNIKRNYRALKDRLDLLYGARLYPDILVDVPALILFGAGQSASSQKLSLLLIIFF